MKHQPKFTIITVTLNCTDTIVSTAQSVLSQNYPDFEYIVKDGGSTDGTIDKLKALGVPVIVRKDTGIYDAMNQAVKLISGNYVCFLNAGDNFVSSSILTNLANFIDSSRYPDFIFGNVDVLNCEKPGRGTGSIHYPNRLSKIFLFRKMICHQAWFVKAEVYKKLNAFSPNYIYAADYDLLLKFILQYKIQYKHYDSTLVYYMGNGFTSLNSINLELEKSRIQNNYFTNSELRVFRSLEIILRSMRLIVVNHFYSYLTNKWRDKKYGD